VTLIVAFYLFLKRRQHRAIKVDCVSTPRNKKTLQLVSNLLKEYSPTLYIPSSLLGMVFSGVKISCFSQLMRQNIGLKDGEVVSLDWTPKNFRQLDPRTPIVILVPGLTNDSRDQYTRIFCEYAYKDYGFRACIFNRRGYAGMAFRKNEIDPITWNKFDDLDQVVNFVHETFPLANIYLAGTSMGANFIQRYAGMKGQQNLPVIPKALGCISSPFCLKAGTKNINSKRLIRFVMTKSLLQTFTAHLHDERFNAALQQKNIDVKHVMASTSSDEFNERFSMAFTEYPTLDDYKEGVSSRAFIRHIPIPTLSVNSKNDEVVPYKAIPYDEIALNENFVQILVSGGGHLEYFSTIKRRRWAYDLVLTYFQGLEKEESTKFERQESEDQEEPETSLSPSLSQSLESRLQE